MDEKDRVNFAKENEKAPEKEEKKEEEKVPEPYPVFGSDYVVKEQEIINYQKYRMKMMIMRYKLVGDVNNRGEYIISNEIKNDLIKMEKEISDKGENFYRAIALYMKKHFYFSVKIEVQEDNMAVASLYLAEWVDNALNNEYIVTHIADYKNIFDDDFFLKVRKVYHLVDVNTKIDDFSVPELAVRMQDLYDLDLVAGGLYDMACQIYIVELLKALEKSGPMGMKLIKEYRRLLGKRNIEVDEKFRFMAYKTLLDHVIEKAGGFHRLGIDMALITPIINNFNQMIGKVEKALSRPGIIEKLNNHKDSVLDKGKSQQSSSTGKAKGVAGKPQQTAKPNAGKSANNSKGTSKTAEKRKDDWEARATVDIQTPPGTTSDNKGQPQGQGRINPLKVYGAQFRHAADDVWRNLQQENKEENQEEPQTETGEGTPENKDDDLDNIGLSTDEAEKFTEKQEEDAKLTEKETGTENENG